MAEDQNDARKDAKDTEEVASLEKVENVIGFNRFLYVETFLSNFVKPKEVVLKKDEDNYIYKTASHFIKQLVETDPSTPLSLIQKVLKNYLNCFFFLLTFSFQSGSSIEIAFCLRRCCFLPRCLPF